MGATAPILKLIFFTQLFSLLSQCKTFHFCKKNLSSLSLPQIAAKKNNNEYIETIKWCGTPVSNRRPSAWQADALPTELVPHWLGNITSY